MICVNEYEQDLNSENLAINVNRNLLDNLQVKKE